jgi:DNA-binding Lrp family transcriptional regulator
MLTDLEKKVIAAVQGDMDVCRRPYSALAENIGVTEEAFLTTLKGLCEQGVVRRFGATLRHQNSGFSANVMIAWVVDEDRINEVGHLFASHPAVSHCYRRNPTPDWSYNLYTMVHAADEKTCLETAGQMAREAAVDTYTLLFSRRELKKTSPRYFTP